jgi:BRCT domain type II-containing protein
LITNIFFFTNNGFFSATSQTSHGSQALKKLNGKKSLSLDLENVTREKTNGKGDMSCSSFAKKENNVHEPKAITRGNTTTTPQIKNPMHNSCFIMFGVFKGIPWEGNMRRSHG